MSAADRSVFFVYPNSCRKIGVFSKGLAIWQRVHAGEWMPGVTRLCADYFEDDAAQLGNCFSDPFNAKVLSISSEYELEAEATNHSDFNKTFSMDK